MVVHLGRSCGNGSSSKQAVWGGSRWVGGSVVWSLIGSGWRLSCVGLDKFLVSGYKKHGATSMVSRRPAVVNTSLRYQKEKMRLLQAVVKL